MNILIIKLNLKLYLEQVDEVDGEDGPHPVVRESLTGLHPNDEKDSPAKWGQSCRIRPR